MGISKSALVAGIGGIVVGAVVAAVVLQSTGGPEANANTVQAAGGEASAVLAEVGETKLTQADLDKAIEQRDAMDLYEIRSRALDNAVESTLLEAEASKQGVPVEKLLKTEVDGKAGSITDAEVKSFFEAQKARMGGKAYDEVKKDIKSMLQERRKGELRQGLLARLREGTKVVLHLEPPRVEIGIKGEPFRGDENAKVVLVEFTDYQCPFCHRAQAAILQVLDEYKGKVKHVIRDFPLSFHQYALKAHEAANCAGDQGKYWEMNKVLFESQQDLKVESLKKFAGTLGLNQKKFDSCLDSDKHKSEIEKDQEEGQSAGVSGTPAFFINGVMISGARPFSDFKAIIDRELQKQSQS